VIGALPPPICPALLDGACSFGFARVRAGKKNATAMADFLEHDIVPAYQEAGIPLVEVVTDGGPEFTGRAFARTCVRLGIRWHKLPPRSPNLNAFVERFQGSVLHPCITAPRSATASTSPARTSTTTCKPGCATTTSNAPTAATAPAAASRRPSSTPADMTSLPRKDGTPMRSTRQPEPSMSVLGRKL
jgi:transposase InsO family protein